MTEKIEKALDLYNKQIEELKIRRNEELYQTISEINSKYNRLINIKNLQKESLSKIQYLNANNIINAIEYLVNQIEEEKYYQVVIPIKYKGKYLTKMKESYLINNFNVYGLTKDKSKVEIRPNQIYTEEELNRPYDNFLNLCHCNKSFSDEHLKVNYLNDKYNEYCNNMSSNIDVQISNKKFSYIKDYIEKVVDYKLDKDGFEVSLDEMKKIADEFVSEYKYSKKLVKRNID